MDLLRIQGGVPLQGVVAVSGAKNAALPIMAASLLADGPVHLHGVPELLDVATLGLLLGDLGMSVSRGMHGGLRLESHDLARTTADYELVRRMRATFCVLGPLLARRGKAIVSLPGGCNLGTRPVDLHLAGLRALGAELRIERGYVIATAGRLQGTRIHLAGPQGPTVTGTANVLSAATLAEGETTITGAATEPEIADLGRFLNAMGARIEGLGTSELHITGVERLYGVGYSVIPDRIEAATLLMAGLITGGQVRVTGIAPDMLRAVLDQFRLRGATVSEEGDAIEVSAPNRLSAADLDAVPYPGVPTDVQAQFMALAALSDGTSTIRDTVFPDRFMHVAELNRLGAHIERVGNTATVRGVNELIGAAVMASDLRGSAALILAGLAARGETTVRRLYHLDRGYARLDDKLRTLGAKIERQREPADRLAPGRRLGLEG